MPQTKKINDCSECDRPSACKNLEILKRMRTGARDAGLLVNASCELECGEEWVWESMSRKAYERIIVL